jgi:hypothetical protein
MDVHDLENKVVCTIIDLPEELILEIATLLNVEDLIRFSHSFSLAFHICNSSDYLWQNHFVKSGFSESKILSDAAESMGAPGNLPNVQKLRYLLHMKTKLNWKNGTPARIYNLEGCTIPDFRNTEPDKMFGLEHPSKTKEKGKSLITLHIWDVKTKIHSSFPWTTQCGLDVAQKFDESFKRNPSIAHHIFSYVSVANIHGNVVLLNVAYPYSHESEIFSFDIGNEGI